MIGKLRLGRIVTRVIGFVLDKVCPESFDPSTSLRASFAQGKLCRRIEGLDRLERVLLALGLLLNLALFAYIGWRYRALPGSLPLHFDILGQPDRLGYEARYSNCQL